jgi:hypothetical protein
MSSSRYSLVLLLAMITGGFLVLSPQVSVRRNGPVGEQWKNHPALAEPDGHSHRGDRMVAADIHDPRIVRELSRRYRQTEPLRLVQQGGETTVLGAEDFERRQEYLLRLLDFYWFSKPRLVGMSRAEVEGIFGPLRPNAGRASISAGRDTLYLWFKEGRVSDAFYAMGY